MFFKLFIWLVLHWYIPVAIAAAASVAEYFWGGYWDWVAWFLVLFGAVIIVVRLFMAGVNVQ